MRDIQVHHSGGHMPVSWHNRSSGLKASSIFDSPSHVHPVTLCSVILTDRSVPVPTDLFWGESSTAKTIAHLDINTHRTTSCQETLKTSKIAHKYKGETLETMQRESNHVSCVLNTHNLISANKSDI